LDPHNDKTFCDRKVSDYWGQVDLYIGGTEHAVGHLLYSRMWTKALHDLGYIGHDEPYKKLVNQGMITGISEFICKKKFIKKDGTVGEGRQNFIHYINGNGDLEMQHFSEDGSGGVYNICYGVDLAREIDLKFKLPPYNSQLDTAFIETRLPIEYINDNDLDYYKLVKENKLYFNTVFATKKGFYYRGLFCQYDHIQDFVSDKLKTKPMIEKMSKSKLNVVNPDDVINKYGADTFRMYEMFLGPVEMSKPWDTKGIEGVYRFLKKFWRLFYDETKWIVNDEPANNEELKVLHKAIKKIEEDTERFSFNTAVSAFMIATNDLTDLKCHKRSILESLLILLAPYAPHICEELWNLLENKTSIVDASYPRFEEKYIKESSKAYPVAINGRTRTELTLALDITQQQVEEIVLKNEIVKKWLDGKPPKKIIYVKNKMINVVI
jgi:leucyl-tRNA synthetase